ncbi:SWIM zinc finger family protein [Hymenobacter actinosclerus]|uniref:SWIM-type domain-containing protein n=1 Tax=Hymenobacter actinosclerus TaxID=82805 RepID=A0A1I0DQP5_9BACT|nr:hypothetical protein [Hymenobacter actinosclerus]SET34248.1 hypothetical protein SAMN04487998_1491 [Hymenobacter actinosclerus]
MFTRQSLKAAANTTSYERGQQYFKRGYVGKISRENNTFKARVEGSERYKVRLTVDKTGTSYRCSCPYDYDGICKHAVALGLAVLQKFGSPVEPLPMPDTSEQALLQALLDTPVTTQLAFLTNLLRTQPKLREQFLLHLTPAAATVASVAARSVPAATAVVAPQELTSIEEVSTEVYEALADLVFDDDALSEHTDYYGDYLEDEGDGMLELADGIIGDVLRPFARLVAGHLAQGRLPRAVEVWVGVYEGATAATDPADDEYSLFSYEGYPARVLDCWDRLLNELGVDARLKSTDFGDAKTEAALTLLFDRYAPQGYPPDYFADLLNDLTRGPAAAQRVREQLESSGRPLSPDQVQALLHSAEKLADDALWLRTAEAHAGQDFGLLQRLLDHYRQHHDQPNQLRLLRQHRQQFSPRLDPYILEHLALADAPDLYLAALEQRCRSTQSLADYEQLRPHWSAEQRRQFVDEQVERQRKAWGGDPRFGAELLVAENREPELLAYLLAHQWLRAGSIPELLTRTARTQPEATFDAVMERTEQALNSSRGRDVYQRIAAWLLALNEFEALRPQVALFATHLYTEYSRLNALREELRAAKLVKTERVGKTYRLVPPTPEDDELRELLRDRKKR